MVSTVHWQRLARLVLITTALLLVLAEPASAALYVIKLSGEMPSWGDVGAVRLLISRDSRWVVYLADAEQDEREDLYSVPIHGMTPIKLSQTAIDGRDFRYVAISPDSQWVVYLADAEVADKYELYSVPIDGSAPPVKLNMPLANDRSVADDYMVLPDSSTVIFRAERRAVDRRDLYAAPIAGGLCITVNHTIVGSVSWGWQITPNGQYIVYEADDDDTGQFQVYYKTLTGPAKRLNGDLPAGASSEFFLVIPDNSGVVYQADEDLAGAFNFYTSHFYIGSTPHPFRITEFPAGTGATLWFEVSSDSQYLVAASFSNGLTSQLYAARVDGAGARLRLHPALVNKDVWSFQLAPDGKRVVYAIQDDVLGTSHLYSNWLTSTVPITLTPALADNRGVAGFSITPNSLGVVYRADIDTDESFKLYSTWISGGTPIPLTPALPVWGTVYNFQISPDNTTVVFTAEALAGGVDELFFVSTLGQGLARLSAPMPPNGDVRLTFLISPSGHQVVYIADARTNDKFELFMVEDAQRLYLPITQR